MGYDIRKTVENLKGVLIDTEYNNINSEKATKMWCASCVDLQTGVETKFHPKEEGPEHYHLEFMDELTEYLEQYDYFVGHNLWAAEYPVLKNLIGFTIEPHQGIDTLVLSRTQRPLAPYMNTFDTLKKEGLDNRQGGHGLAAWGKRRGVPKINFDKFEEYSHEMMVYCSRDTELNVDVFNYLIWEMDYCEFPSEVFYVENESHRRLHQQSVAGFTLHKERAAEMLDTTGELLQEYLNELHKIFPPKKKILRTLIPRFTKYKVRGNDGKLLKDPDGSQVFEGKMHGTDHNTLRKNLHEAVMDDATGKPTGEYLICEMVTFNPNSPQQVGDRLIDLGWNPRKFTATGQPSTAKDVLGGAIDILAPKVPEVEVLRKYNVIAHRNNLAKEWLELAKEDGRVHGRVNHIGPWTHRSSHFQPNLGNIAKVRLDDSGEPLKGLEGDFGWDSRHCWIPREGWKLVGCDASGIQLRALAHYMGDPTYIKEVCEGDIHVANMKAAGIKDRPTSKTFIYAWLLGAGDEKIGQIVGVTPEEYEELFKLAEKEYKWNFYRKDQKDPKFNNLLFWATDKLRSEGRIADKPTTAIILKGYYTKKKFLDNLPALKRFKEKDVQAAADIDYMVGLDGRRIWVPNAHFAVGAYLQGFEAVVMKTAMVLYQDKLDELGIPFAQVGYVHDEWILETPPEFAEKVLEITKWSIPEAGRLLGSKCPLDSDGRIGNSWGEVH